MICKIGGFVCKMEGEVLKIPDQFEKTMSGDLGMAEVTFLLYRLND